MICKQVFYVVVNVQDKLMFVDSNGELSDTLQERFYIESEKSAKIKAKQLSRKGYKFFVKSDSIDYDPF